MRRRVNFFDLVVAGCHDPRPGPLQPIRSRCGACADTWSGCGLLIPPDHCLYAGSTLIPLLLVKGVTMRSIVRRLPSIVIVSNATKP